MDKSIPENKEKSSIFKDIIVPTIIGLLIVFLLRTFVIGMYYVPSGSMIPTLEINDHVLVTKLSYHMHDPERGDVIVFKYPVAMREENKTVYYVKRLIGLPGDNLEIRNNQVLINGKAIKELYVAPDTNMPDFGPVKIGKEQYFMMGDNRNHSNDSRFWGTVPREYLVGKVKFVYWPFARIGSLY